ncbi:TonB-dependent receptor [Stenotrophomonas tumulicola]|uniref:TonB-dependent receptor n=1 Tax=Stenotrophomonas tumulicola TaxID=1685415 RepID=A0A7W3FL12_9GAMM|nr:TonB-dependent receptor [Stenotrophomonas tumulicola]MBA8681463.1 TonB-dependent receptor [Stenotrophomonas tumulicola]
MTQFQSARPWYRKQLSLAIAGALACCSAPALAQDAMTLDTVVVTANKRVENVREVGASISVIGERQLENIGAVSLSDYAAYIPGLQVQNEGSPGLTRVSLRGISALSSGATVSTYIDDVPVGSSGIYQGASGLMLDLLPYDISRVEVLRGPQGTLYGAGAIGGLLKYVTRAPEVAGEETRVGFGLRSVQGGGQEWNARFGASLPLKEDRLGLRMSFARNGIAGFTDNAVDGRKDINDGDQIGARTALSWDGDAFDLGLSVLHQRTRSDDRAGVALDADTLAPLFGEQVDVAWQPRPFSKDLTLTSLSLDWDLGWGNFVSATGWSQTDTVDQIDSTVQFGEVADLLAGLPEPGSSSVRYSFDLDKITQELRLVSKTGGKFEWMVGGFYTREDALQSQFARLDQRDGSPLPAPFDDMFGTLAIINLPSTYKEYALFANGSWRFGERFKIDVGMRQARNDQWFSQNVPTGILAPIGDAPGESSEDVFTWSLSPQFKLSDSVMLYARAATGYQPGGPNVALLGMPPQVDSSMLDSYEIGVKSQFADRRVTFDLSVFRIDWEDIQVASSFNGIGGLVNGGEATSKGVELTSLFSVTDALTLGLNAAYTDASLKEDFDPTVIPQGDFDVILWTGLAGDRMPYTPRLSWTATAEYAFSTAGGLTGQVGGAFRWTGERLNDTTERQRITAPGDPDTQLAPDDITAPLKLGSYRALDLYAGIGRGSWELRAYVNNVTGENAWLTMAPVSGALSGVTSRVSAVPIQPRTFGLEVDLRF